MPNSSTKQSSPTLLHPPPSSNPSTKQPPPTCHLISTYRDQKVEVSGKLCQPYNNYTCNKKKEDSEKEKFNQSMQQKRHNNK